MRLALAFLFFVSTSHAQVSSKLETALNGMLSDPQFRNATVSMYVVDSRTGRVVYEKNHQAGLAPASCQKVITAVTAFELLGRDYTYKTKLGYDGKLDSGLLTGNIYITGSGDPTLGSTHYTTTIENVVLNNFKNAVRSSGIKQLKGLVLADDRLWGTQKIPDGWIWQDIGNYYEAGASALNWRENQYDLILRSGKRKCVECSGANP